MQWLVLFDIDWTLIYSRGCGRAATKLALPEVFGTLGAVDEVNFAGKTDWQILLECLQPVGFTMEQVAEKIEIYNETVSRHLAAIIAQYPVRACEGTVELVQTLSANPEVLVGLVTGNMPGLVPIKLGYTGFDPADFKIGAFGCDGWERPMLPPLALERAKAYSGVDFPAEHTVIIGDTPGDVACATSIKAKTIAVATGPYTVEQLSACQPDYVFRNLSDHETVLAAIFKNGQYGC
jgi:phosphoglycolate phosphatase-like HAD superfamily hydrolase